MQGRTLARLLTRVMHVGGGLAPLQELQERLEATEAAAAASAAEHCDAMWAKGQVAGLLELNDDLQQQLEQRGQELEELKAALQL